MSSIFRIQSRTFPSCSNVVFHLPTMPKSLLHSPPPHRRHRFRHIASSLTLLFIVYPVLTLWLRTPHLLPPTAPPPLNPQLKRNHDRCKALYAPAGPSPFFEPVRRLKWGSDRYVPGTRATLIRNAVIWTGEANGTDVLFGDILLDKGLVVSLGDVPMSLLERYEGFGAPEGEKEQIEVMDVGGQWVTPGLVDLHSHIGVESAPILGGEFLFILPTSYLIADGGCISVERRKRPQFP